MSKLVDSVGNEYINGAIVKVKHFETARKKYYMYKQVCTIHEEKGFVEFYHLPFSPCKTKKIGDFRLNAQELKSRTLIVEAHYKDYRELRRNKDMLS